MGYTTPVRRQELEHLKTPSISFLLAKSPTTKIVITNNDTMSATERMKLAHELRSPAYKVGLVPGLHSTLLIGVNFSDVDYVTILDKEGINIYDGKTTKIIISEKAVLSGYLTE